MSEHPWTKKFPANGIDGWENLGVGWWWWLHPASKRSVTVDKQSDGWVVSCRRHDDHGNPVDGETLVFDSKDAAWNMAKAIRRSIEAESNVVQFPTQLGMFPKG